MIWLAGDLEQAIGNAVLLAVGGWLDAGSATGKTALALGGVVLIVGAIAGLFLLVFGWIKCRMVAVRRTVNHKAVRGFEVVLAGWLIVYIGIGLSFTSVYRLWLWPLLAVAGVVFAAGAGFGVVALLEMRKDPRRYNYGQGQAIAAIVAGCLPLLVMVLLGVAVLAVYGTNLSALRMLARGQHDSTEFGYHVQLDGRLWKSWPRMSEKMPGADFGVVSLLGDCGLFVVPVSLGGREVDFGAIVEAMLAETGLAPGNAKLETVTAPVGAQEEERHFRLFRLQEGGGVWYRFRIAQARGVAYLVCAWVDQREGASNDRLDEDVMRVALDGAGAASAASRSPSGEARHARIFRRIAAYLEKRGDRARAAEWLADAVRLDGGAAVGVTGSGGGVAKALFLLDAGCAQEALGFAESALLGDPANLTAIATKSVALGRLGRVHEGLEALEAAPKAAADHSAIAAAGAHLRALERGSKAPAMGEPVDAVPVPGALFQLPASSAAPSAAQDAGLVCDWAVTAVRFRKGEPPVETRYCQIRVLSEAGAKAFSAIEEGYEPGRESIYVNQVLVLDEGGKRGEKIEPKTSRRDEEGDAGRARLHVALPPLRPGMAVGWVVTARRHLPALHFPYVAHSFSRQWPVRRSVFWLDGDFQAVTASSTPGVPQPQRQPRPHWVVEDPPVKPAGELLLPADPAYLPTVWVCEAAVSWPELGASYLEAVRMRQGGDAGLRELAGAAVAGAEGVEAKTLALARFAQRHLSDAPGGFCAGDCIPAAAGETARRRVADTKGRAAFLQAMLTAQGIDAHLALVAAGGFAQVGMPSLDQFNHVVVFVPGLVPLQFVDCSAKDIDPTKGVSGPIAARKALVLDPKGPQLMDVSPRLAIAEVAIERIATARSDGGWDLRETARFLGPAKAMARAWFGAGGGFGREAALRETRGVEISGANIREELDFSKPLVVEISGTARPKDGGAGPVRVPAMIESLLLDLSALAQKKGPAWLDAPVRIRGSLAVEAVSGGKGAAPPRPADIAAPMLTCKFGQGEVFDYVIERGPGLAALGVFRQLAEDSARVIGAIEPAAPVGAAPKQP